jgi:hypothetical protein
LIQRAVIGTATVLAIIVVGPPSPAVPQISVHSVEVEGTAFRITLSDGHVLGQEELPGVWLMIGDGSGQQPSSMTPKIHLVRSFFTRCLSRTL